MVGQQTPRRARHLMDPSLPRVAPTPQDRARLERVQRVVLSVLVFTTIIHLSVGLVIGAFFLDEQYLPARVGLCVIGGLTGVCAVAAARAIHRRAPVSPWLLLGLLPGVVGVLVVVT